MASDSKFDIEAGKSSNMSVIYYSSKSSEDISTTSREEITHRKAAKSSSRSMFFISDKFDSLDYNPILNQLEVAKQKRETFGSLVMEDSIRILIFVIAGVFTALICMAMEAAIHIIGHFKYVWFSHFLVHNFENRPYDLPMIISARFALTAVPIMLGTFLVVYFAPFASGGGVAQCIAFLNGVRVPNVLSVKGTIVKFFSTICCCVSGLAGGKEGPAMHIGAFVAGAMPSVLPWLRFRSDQERRDLAAAGFGAGIATVFGAPIGGMLLALEEGVSFWDISLMWKMYLCCLVAYAVASVDSSVFLGVNIRLNNPELSTLGSISATVTRYELFELIPFALQAVIASLIGTFLIKIHIYVTHFRNRFMNTNKRKILWSLMASVMVTAFQVVSLRCFRICSKLTPAEIEHLGNDTLKRETHQLYCDDDEHSDMSMLFEQTQTDILRTFFGMYILQASSLVWYSFVYFFLVCMTWGLTISYGVFVPQIIFGAAWGRLYGTLLQKSFPGAEWAQPAKYAYIGAAAQLSSTVGKTFSILMIMIEASGSINFSFPLMLVVVITKVVGTFFVVPIYHTQMLMSGIPYLFAKPPPLSLDTTAMDVMSGSITTLPKVPTVREVIHVLTDTTHNGFPIVENPPKARLLGLILRQQLLVLLKYKAYKFPPPKTNKQMRECYELYIRLARKRFKVQKIVDSVSPEDQELKLDLTLYYDAFPATVAAMTPAVRAYVLFRNLALRHLIVLDDQEPLGMITRKDMAKFRTFENFFRMGVVEMVVKVK